MAVKDNVDLAGVSTRNGSAATSDEPAAADAELVRRLREAGALLVGKTSVPELCLWPFTESEAFGISRNPWSLEHTPGGSSGGSAAAVASAMVPIALATDGGGSIRMPASNCGLLGIKPGPGVVPFPANGVSTWSRMSEFGPLATTVADLGLALDVLAGGGGYRAVVSPEAAAGRAASPGAVGVGRPEVLAAGGDRRDPGRGRPPGRTADPPRHNGDAAPFLRRVLRLPRTPTAPWRRWSPAPGLRPDGPDAAGPGRPPARRSGSSPATGLVRGPRPAAQPDPGRATAARRRLPGQGPGPDAARSDAYMPPCPPSTRSVSCVGPGRRSAEAPPGAQLAAVPGAEALLLSVARQLETLRLAPARPDAGGRPAQRS